MEQHSLPFTLSTFFFLLKYKVRGCNGKKPNWKFVQVSVKEVQFLHMFWWMCFHRSFFTFDLKPDLLLSGTAPNIGIKGPLRVVWSCHWSVLNQRIECRAPVPQPCQKCPWGTIRFIICNMYLFLCWAKFFLYLLALNNG